MDYKIEEYNGLFIRQFESHNFKSIIDDEYLNNIEISIKKDLSGEELDEIIDDLKKFINKHKDKLRFENKYLEKLDSNLFK